jgi:hypothetical protein
MVDLIHEFIYLFQESLVLESAGIKVRLLRGRVEVVGYVVLQPGKFVSWHTTLC